MASRGPKKTRESLRDVAEVIGQCEQELEKSTSVLRTVRTTLLEEALGPADVIDDEELPDHPPVGDAIIQSNIFKKSSFSQMVTMLLTRNPQGMLADELLDAMVRGGWTTTSAKGARGYFLQTLGKLVEARKFRHSPVTGLYKLNKR